MRIDKAIEVVRGIRRKQRSRATDRLVVPKTPVRLYMQPVRKPWTWEDGAPRERANFIRSNSEISGISTEDLCDLFDLTGIGLADILRGRDWKPEHCRATAQPTPAVME